MIYEIPKGHLIDKTKIIKIIEEKLAPKVFPFVVDVTHSKIKFYSDGFLVTVLQDDKEAQDIIEYFVDRFTKRFGTIKKNSDFCFVDYSPGSKVSSVAFYYKFNRFFLSFGYFYNKSTI